MPHIFSVSYLVILAGHFLDFRRNPFGYKRKSVCAIERLAAYPLYFQGVIPYMQTLISRSFSREAP